MYSNHRCRCEACKRANADAQTAYQRRLGRRPAAEVFVERRAAAEARDNHGTEGRYRLGCHCRPCKDASAAARRSRRERAR